MILNKHHTFLVALRLRQPEPQHSPAEAEGLSRWAEGRRSLVEIGVAEGASAVVLRRAMAADGLLSLIDPFHLSRNPLFNTGLMAARRTVGRVNRGEVRFVVASSLEAARSWTDPLDFVFIDANHEYQSVMADWYAWSLHVEPGGVVAFHDAIRKVGHPEGPAAAVDALFRSARQKGWKIVDEIDTLVVVEKLRESFTTGDTPASGGFRWV